MLAADFIQAISYLPKELYFRLIYELDKHPELIGYAQNNFKRKAEALRSNDPQALKKVVDEEIRDLRRQLDAEHKKSQKHD